MKKEYKTPRQEVIRMQNRFALLYGSELGSRSNDDYELDE